VKDWSACKPILWITPCSAARRCGAIISTGPTMAVRAVKRQDDGRTPVDRQAARAGSAASGEQSSDEAALVAAIYRRAAVASGFAERALPDGTVTLEQTGRADFAELDRCLRELAGLGVEPVWTDRGTRRPVRFRRGKPVSGL